ncbi:transposase [Novipirellula sp. SH528]|uniref:transposase n=1 Tax=Novipirellula sp. SH528 TaxID=3454466 RepID=UPI003FA11D7B
MRRVDCPDCGVIVECVPWCECRQRTTRSFRIFLANWARSLSWQEPAKRFGTSWDTVFRSIEWVVRWGLVHLELGKIRAIGVDEIQFRRGQKYLTLVYQVSPNCRRLLYVAKDRTEESINDFLWAFSDLTMSSVKCICSNMWSSYLKVAAEKASHTVRILGRFHVMKKLSEKIN